MGTHLSVEAGEYASRFFEPWDICWQPWHVVRDLGHGNLSGCLLLICGWARKRVPSPSIVACDIPNPVLECTTDGDMLGQRAVI